MRLIDQYHKRLCWFERVPDENDLGLPLISGLNTIGKLSAAISHAARQLGRDGELREEVRGGVIVN